MKMYKCRFVGCSNLIPQSGYCDKHKQFEAKRKPFFPNAQRTNTELYNTTRWRNLRKQKLEEQPCCEKCGRTDNLQVHHLIPPKGNEELFYDYANLGVLCGKCHLQETLKEVNENKNND